MSAMWIAPAIGPVEQDGPSAQQRRQRRRGPRVRMWLKQWEAILIAELVWLTSGRREQ